MLYEKNKKKRERTTYHRKLELNAFLDSRNFLESSEIFSQKFIYSVKEYLNISLLQYQILLFTTILNIPHQRMLYFSTLYIYHIIKVK